jgi:hypothetical protein
MATTGFLATPVALVPAVDALNGACATSDPTGLLNIVGRTRPNREPIVLGAFEVYWNGTSADRDDWPFCSMSTPMGRCRCLADRLNQPHAPVAQLDRALPSEGKGHTFESCRVRQFIFMVRRAMRARTETPSLCRPSE